MKHLRIVLALVLALAIMLPAGMSFATAEAELTPLSVLGYAQGSGRVSEFDKSKTYEWLIEETRKLGIDLQLEYVEADQYSTTMTTRLATGTDLADMMFLEVDNVTLNNLINRGMLTSVDAILEKSNGTAAGYLAPDGEYAVIRNAGTGEDGTFWVLQGVNTNTYNINEWIGAYSVGIRQDWLDKLELPMPTTIDEFVDTMVAFRENDANGNGLNDEKVLFASDLSLLRHSGIAAWYGLILNPIGLDPVTDKITSVFYQDGFKDYIGFIKKMVDAGVMSLADKGSLYTTDTSALIAQNNIGAMYYQTASMYTRDELSGDATANYVPLFLKGVEMPTARGDYNLSVYTGYYAFMNGVDLDAAAKLLDFCFTEDYWQWCRNGLEGNDYELDAMGNVVSLTTNWTAEEVMAKGFGGGRFYMDRAMLPIIEMARTYATFNGEKVGTFTTAADLMASAYGQNELAKLEASDTTGTGKRVELQKIAWEQMEQKDAIMYQTNTATYLALPTDEEVEILDMYTADLDMVMTDLFIELIKGNKDLEKLDEYLEDLKAYGLDEVLAVYQSRYDRFKGE